MSTSLLHLVQSVSSYVNFLNGYSRPEPFFLKVSFARPHSPYDPPQRFMNQYANADLPAAKVVKAFNHIQAAHLTTDRQAAGTPNRRGLVIAGDDEKAKATVTRLLDQFGFDTVDAGPLKEGWRIQRDTPGYGPRRTAEELRQDLAAAKRYADM